MLDALCLALFDKTPRLSTRGGVPIGRPDEDESLRLPAYDVRSLLRRGTGVGHAEVEFSGRDGRRYLARWDVRRARQRADGKLQPQSMNLHDVETGRPLGGTKSETLLAIEERLGLSFEQFRRSALLAQGEFAAFLKANARARAELLERMTGTEIYGAVSIAAFRRASDELGELRNLLKLCDEHAVLSDDAREQLEAQRVGARAELEAKERQLAASEAAVVWYRRSRELLASESEAVGTLNALEAEWVGSATWRDRFEAVVAAQALRAVVADWDRLSAGIVAGAANVAELDAAATAKAAERDLLVAESDSAGAELRAARAAFDAVKPELTEAARHDVEIGAAVRAAEEAVDALAHSAKRTRRAASERDAAATRIAHLERADLDALRQVTTPLAKGRTAAVTSPRSHHRPKGARRPAPGGARGDRDHVRPRRVGGGGIRQARRGAREGACAGAAVRTRGNQVAGRGGAARSRPRPRAPRHPSHTRRCGRHRAGGGATSCRAP